VLGLGGVTISTVEHLLAALWGLGIEDAEIRIRGAEVPILDGSASPYAGELLACATASSGVGPSVPSWVVTRGFCSRSGSGQCHLIPTPTSSTGAVIECFIDFCHPMLGRQHARFENVPKSSWTFLTRFAPARTFGFLEEAALLRRRGLAHGATLSSVLVYGPRGVLNPGGTRFRDEPVRHKVVDAMGDLALLGGILKGRLRLVRCSHRLLIETLKRALAAGALVRI
jgi:UDP-3-O-[3-hydroxymyristoyl] N-acetylglucosamine deacetylase